MQREIEALLAAYVEDRQREAKLIHDLLAALAVSAAGRQRMFDAVKAAVEPAAQHAAGTATTSAGAAEGQMAATIVDDLTISIGSLRKARDAAFTH